MLCFSLRSVVVRRIPQCLSARSAVAVGLLLCLLMAGCDVRPFSDFADDDMTEETEETPDDGEDPDPEEPPPTESLELDLSATPIAAEVGVEATTQVNIGERNPEGMYRFDITTEPSMGTADIDPDTGRLTFTSQTALETDRLVVTVTETVNGVTTGSDTIEIPITVVEPG
jgi:hypothetical protein